ncbi:ribosome 60S biogenesis N-terminal-domain-containing protein [Entophlyctis helioformis]|nr:ribosome 60S biogenesis N-terminal-domain-containing protein [Entophlyctis helioformis]
MADVESTLAPAAAASAPQTLLTVAEWQKALQSDNVQVQEAGLTAFAGLVRKVALEEVDAEVSYESEMLRKWLKASLECADLVRVLDFQVSSSVPQLEPVINCVAYTLAASRLVGHRSTGTSLARSVIRNHLKMVYRNLSSGKPILVQSTLRLLVALASHGSSTTRELHESFNFTHKSFPSLLKIRKKGATGGSLPDDIRTLTIQFMLAFINRGDASIKKTVLETKEFLAGIIKDIKNDPFETINLVLSTLQRGIVDDHLVSRTSKISFFNNRLLDQLLALYSLSDASNPKLVSPTDKTTTVAMITHNFFLHICTKPGVGICFADFGWYPAVLNDGAQQALDATAAAADSLGSLSAGGGSARVYNKSLLKLLSSLKISGTDMYQRELFLSILDACPELVHPFWTGSGSHLVFEPRSSTQYLANMALATSAVKLPIPPAFIGRASSTVLAPPPVSHALSNILPTVLARHVAARALQHGSRDVRFACTAFLTSALAKFQDTLQVATDIVQSLHASDNPNALAAERMWTEWIAQVSQQMRLRLPDVQIAIVLQQHTAQEEAGDSVSADEMLVSSLAFIRRYQSHFADLWRESRFDFGKLVPPTLCDEPAHVQASTVALLQDLRDFRLFSKFPKADHTHFYTLMRLVIKDGTDASVKADTLALLDHLLSSLFPMQDHAGAFRLFIDVMTTFTADEQIALVELVDNAFVECTHNSLVISDTISRLTRLHRRSDPADSRVADRPSSRDVDNDMDVDEPDQDAVPVGHTARFQFPFPPALASLVRASLNSAAASLQSQFTALLVQAVLGRTGSQSSAAIFALLLDDAHWPQGAQESTIMQWCRAWAVAASGSLDLETPTATAKTPSWKKGSKRLQAASEHEYRSALVELGPEFVVEHAAKLVETFGDHKAETLRLLQLYLPLSSNSTASSSVATLLESANSDGWLGDCSLPLLLHCVFALYGRDAVAESPALRAHLVDAFGRTDPANMQSFLCSMGSLLLWAYALLCDNTVARASKAGRLALAAELLTKGLETVSSMDGRDVRALVFGHSFVLDLFLEQDSYGSVNVEGLVRFVLPADGIIMTSYASKLWSFFDSLLHSSSRSKPSAMSAHYSLFELTIELLAPHLLSSDLSERIEHLLAKDKRSALDERLLFSLVGAYITSSGDGLRSDHIRMHSSLFQQLLLSLTRPPVEGMEHSRNSASALVSQLVLGGSKTSRSAHPTSSVDQIVGSYSVVTERGIQAVTSSAVERVPVPLDVWSVLSADKLVAPLAKSNDPNLWRLVLACAASSVPHAHRLLQMLVAGEDKTKSHGVPQIWRQATLRVLTRAWMHVSDTRSCTVQWLGNLPAEYSSMLGLDPFERKEDTDCISSIAFCGSTDAMSLAVLSAAISPDGTSAWLREFVPRFLKSGGISDPARAAASVAELLPALDQIARRDPSARIGDLLLFRDDPDAALASALQAIIAHFRIADRVEPSIDAPRIESMALAKSVMTTCLKHRIADSMAVTLLRHLVTLLYRAKGSHPHELPSPSDLIGMIATHSQFDELLAPSLHIKSISPIPRFHATKPTLVRLLSCIMALDPVACCKPDLLPKLVQHYYGTVSKADRSILSLLMLYESRAAISVAVYLGAWGASQQLLNQQQRQDQDEQDPALTAALFQAPANEALGAIDMQWMAQSLRWFPIDLDVTDLDSIDTDDEPANERDPAAALHASGLDPLYDAAFIIPFVAGLFVHSKKPVDAHRLLESNALGMCIMGLASESAATRRMSHFALAHGIHLLDGSRLKERNQVMMLLTALKNSIVVDDLDLLIKSKSKRQKTSNAKSNAAKSTEPIVPPRIPTLIAAFCAQAIMVLLKPSRTFPLATPIDGLEDVPLFYAMLFSSTETCTRDRIWLLKLLAMGLRTADDYKLYRRRQVIDILMSYFHSTLADPVSRKLVIEILVKAAAIPSVLSSLVTRSGLVGFLESCCAQLDMRDASDVTLGVVFLATYVVRNYTAAVLGRLNEIDAASKDETQAVAQAQNGRRIARASLLMVQFARIAGVLTGCLATDLRPATSVGRRAALTLRILRMVQVTIKSASTLMKAASALVASSAEIDVSLPSSVALLKTATAFLGTADLQQLLRVCETLRPLEAGGDQNATMDVNVDGDDSDVDAIFAMPRVPHGVAYRHAMLRLLGIAGSAVAVSSGQTPAQHAAFVGQLRDMHAWIRRTQASGDSRTASAAIEPLVQWIVRHLLGNSSDLVAYLVCEAPSALCEILQLLFGCHDAAAAPPRLRQLALAGLLLIVRHWTTTDAGHSAQYRLDDWATDLLARILPRLALFTPAPRSLLRLADNDADTAGDHMQLPPAFEAVVLGQLHRMRSRLGSHCSRTCNEAFFTMPSTTVILIRHAEKLPWTQGLQPGSGVKDSYVDNHLLSAKGYERAQALTGYFLFRKEMQDLFARRPLAAVAAQAVDTSADPWGRSRRPLETVEPLVQAWNTALSASSPSDAASKVSDASPAVVDAVAMASGARRSDDGAVSSAKPQTPHPLPLIQVCKKDLGDLIAFLKGEPHRLQAPHMPASLDGRSIIVSWSHQQLPAIARYLGAPCELVPDKWQGPRFDVTWVVEIDEGQEPTFRQMPQRLLYGDGNDVIAVK